MTNGSKGPSWLLSYDSWNFAHYIIEQNVQTNFVCIVKLYQFIMNKYVYTNRMLN
jgi:hypothetical protein